jgi:hypothetical protein
MLELLVSIFRECTLGAVLCFLPFNLKALRLFHIELSSSSPYKKALFTSNPVIYQSSSMESTSIRCTVLKHTTGGEYLIEVYAFYLGEAFGD